MKLDLGKAEKLIEGVWAEYDNDVKFKIRYVSPKHSRMSRRKFTKMKNIQGIRQEQMSRSDEDKWDIDLWDYMIEDWKGIEIDNNPAPCTKENKKLLADHSADHATFIMDFAMSISNYQDSQQQEIEEKNSETSSPSA